MLEDYHEIPQNIVLGYTTMIREVVQQIEEQALAKPTHVFLQAGVGSMAGGVLGWLADTLKAEMPVASIIEATDSACVFASCPQGKLVSKAGITPTIMAGLACGEPNTISWDILKNHVDTFVAAPDWVAAKGMRMLAAPIKGDTPVTSGESGAAPFGTLACIMCMDEYQELREHLGLDETSRVLLFSTEGDTDPTRYESIVWDGNER